MKKNEEYQLKYEKLKIHMGYWIFMLSILSIGLFAVRSHGSESLSSEIAFGATLSGIILSVIAIIITIIGETKSENAKDTLVNISTDLEEIVESIKSATEKLEEAKISKEDIKEIQSDLRRLSGEFMGLNQKDVNESKRNDILSVDYIKVYNLYAENMTQIRNQYTLIIGYFIIAQRKRNCQLDVKELNEILAQHEVGSKKDNYEAAILSLMVFAPIMKISSADNKFNRFIENEIKDKYPEIKNSIDEVINKNQEF